MTVVGTKNPDDANLQADAENAVQSANGLISSCAALIRQLGTDVRAIAMETIDVLLASPSDVDIGRRKAEVTKQYSSLLLEFSNAMDAKVKLLNWSWTDVDQSMGFYLIDKGGKDNTDPAELRQLTDAMSNARKEIPDTAASISNLTVAIRSSAGGLTGLEEPIVKSTRTLERLNGELDVGDAVLRRQIILAGRLFDTLSQS